MRRRSVVAVLVVSLAFGAAAQVWGMRASGGVNGRVAQGYLGVDVRDLSDDELNQLKIKDVRAAEIVRLDHDGPACKAGVRERDVVLQMDGQPIEGREQFRRLLHEEPAGHVVVLVILRDGQQQTLRATMANREEVERQAWQQHIAVVDPEGSPAPAEAASKPSGHGLGFLHGGSGADEASAGKSRGFLGTMLGAPNIGALVEPVGPQLGQFFGVPSGIGLLVKSVEVNSPAAEAGLRAGDVVLKANQTPMATESDWTKSLHENKGRAMPVLVLRDRKEQTLTLTPDTKRRASLIRPAPAGTMAEGRISGMDFL